MNVHSAPIGVFDSGLGGLSVLREIRTTLPKESLIYAADSLYCPYGSRSEQEIRWRSLLIASALAERGAKLLVIACNTATAVALEALRDRFDLPIIGLEPAVKPAVAMSQRRRIGVLATPRTAASARLRRLIERYGDDAIVRIVPAPGLVELVESGSMREAQSTRLVRTLVEPLMADGVDTIVLGCTHYPFLREVIQEIVGDAVTLVDSGPAIARRTRELVEIHDMANKNDLPGELRILTTGEIESVTLLASSLLGEQVVAEHLPLDERRYALAESEKLSAAWTSSVSAGA